MADPRARPPSVREAKARLLAAAEAADPSLWIRRHPGRALLLAAALGVLSARLARRSALPWPTLLPLLLRLLNQR